MPKRCPTRVTHVRPFPRVLSHVGLQTGALLELTPALSTLELLRVVVRLRVLDDVRLPVALVTDGALAGLVVRVSQHVELQMGRPGKPFPALRTHVGFLPQMDEALVSRQRALVHEALAADGAHVLPDPHVGLEVLVAAAPGLVHFAALLANELPVSSLSATSGHPAWHSTGGRGGVQLGETALYHRQEHKFKQMLEGPFCLGAKTLPFEFCLYHPPPPPFAPTTTRICLDTATKVTSDPSQMLREFFLPV